MRQGDKPPCLIVCLKDETNNINVYTKSFEKNNIFDRGIRLDGVRRFCFEQGAGGAFRGC